MRTLFDTDDYAAYCHCPRKAFLSLSGHPAGNPHEYVQAIAATAAKNASSQLRALAAAAAAAGRSVAEDLRSQADLIVRPTIQFRDLAASPVALLASKNTAPGKGVQYEPVLAAGTCRVDVEHKNRLNYIGYVLTQVQHSPPARGLVFTADGARHSVRLDTTHRAVESAIAILRTWPADSKAAEPPAVLNDHCPSCEFRVGCEEKARQADDLSLLDRVTPKLLRRYHKKGIFTVKQLSYIFRPRRSRKVPHGKTASFNVELQALAVRTGKIYLQQVPKLTRNSVELFLDIEGVPDRGSYYLFGVLVCDGKATTYHSYWADDAKHEHEAFAALVDKLTEHPDAPIYHYGRYEKQALATLEGRGRHHGVAFESVRKRLVNISASIYGKGVLPGEVQPPEGAREVSWRNVVLHRGIRSAESRLAPSLGGVLRRLLQGKAAHLQRGRLPSAAASNQRALEDICDGGLQAQQRRLCGPSKATVHGGSRRDSQEVRRHTEVRER